MKNIIILGNGPSIKKFRFKSIRNSFIIGTNNLIHNKIFSQNKNYIYTAYDESFFKNNNIKWLNAINRSKCQIFFSKNDKNSVLNDLKIKINNFDLLKRKTAVKNFLNKFSTNKNLMSTVIIERALPLAIYLAVKNKISVINLLGCEFNYFLKKNGRLSDRSYFYGKKNIFFKHTINTSEKWKLVNISKFLKIKSYLKSLKIKIIDNSKNGSLNFLNNL
jgi:hypothetical protein